MGAKAIAWKKLASHIKIACGQNAWLHVFFAEDLLRCRGTCGASLWTACSRSQSATASTPKTGSCSVNRSPLTLGLGYCNEKKNAAHPITLCSPLRPGCTRMSRSPRIAYPCACKHTNKHSHTHTHMHSDIHTPHTLTHTHTSASMN